MPKQDVVSPLAALVCAGAFLSAVPAAAGQDVEWRAYAADAASSKYVPLDQIDAESVHDLEIVWRQSTIPTPPARATTCARPPRRRTPP